MPTYGDYLKLDQLLALQQPLSRAPEHDEMLFIVIHQVYELWFKEILHEVDYLQELLSRNEGIRAGNTLKRVLTILKVMVAQLDILETMTPLEFLSFRDRLESGSGFQSFQFRELEFVLGWKEPRALERYPTGSPAARRLQSRLAASTLWDAFLRFLATNGIAIPAEDLERDVTGRVEGSAGLRTALIEVYRHHPALAELCERLVDLDEGLMEWRYRHVKMVQRTIGTRRGTRGRGRPAYLPTTPRPPRPAALPGSLGHSHRAVVDLTSLTGSPNPLAAHYRRFGVADRLLLTGHSHQAWPDVGFEAQAEAWLGPSGPGGGKGGGGLAP